MRTALNLIFCLTALMSEPAQSKELDCAALYAKANKANKELSPSELKLGKRKIEEISADTKLNNPDRHKQLLKHTQVLRQDPEAFLNFALDYPVAMVKAQARRPNWIVNPDVLVEALRHRPLGKLDAKSAEAYLSKLVKRSKPQANNSLPSHLNIPSTTAILKETIPLLSPAKQEQWINKLTSVIFEHNDARPSAFMDDWGVAPGNQPQVDILFARLRADAGMEIEPKIHIRNLYPSRSELKITSSHQFPASVDEGTHWSRTVSVDSLVGEGISEPMLIQGPHGKTIRISRLTTAQNMKRARRTAPKYSEMYQDGVKRGIFWPDAGFSAHEGRPLMQEYINNFKDMGFKFKTAKVDDFKKYLSENINNSNLDYMLREGHHGPLDIKVHSKGELHIGTQTKAGRKQEVLVYMPSAGRNPKQDLTWDEMHSAFEHRKRNHALYYIDTKCSALNSLCTMMIEARTEHLHVIAPSDIAMTFTNEESNALRALVNGFVEEKNYPTIRKNMQKARNLSRTETNGDADIYYEDRFAFEDSTEYHFEVSSAVTRSVGIFHIEVSP